MRSSIPPPLVSSHDFSRNQAETEFTPILQELIHGRIGALGAVLFDADGETVDHYSGMGEYDIKLVAAHTGIIVRFASDALFGICKARPQEVVFSTSSVEFTTVFLGDGYCLSIVTTPRKSNTTLLRLLLPRIIARIKAVGGM